MLTYPRISLQTLIPAGLSSAGIALAVSLLVDSYFWQRLIWPELAGFWFNAIQGKSEEWGTSPIYFYFSSLLPKLLLNPLISLVLIPFGFAVPATKYAVNELVIPSMLFVAIYSLQPHKEARFIIYVVPPLTAAASLSASYIWTRRTKTLVYRITSIVLLASAAGSFIASTAMLLISSLNYPGGEALSQLHSLIETTSYPTTSLLNPPPQNISIHMDILSCMTGVTRFEQYPSLNLSPSQLPLINGIPTRFWYDKTENQTQLLEPAFWEQFDYALMEEPEKAIGKWEVVGVVRAYSGIEVLRPGVGAMSDVDGVYAANNATKNGEVRNSEEVRDVAEGMVGLEVITKEKSLGALKRRLSSGKINRAEVIAVLRDTLRRYTGGWWIGPRMRPKIKILRRVKEPLRV
jgi:alpha-1,6-mannosyltransferase